MKYGIMRELIGRFSKTILAHPELVRWIDVKFLTEEISKSLNYVAIKLSTEYDEDDVTIVRNIYKTTLKSGSIDLSAEFKPIYNRFRDELEEKKKELSNYMTKKDEQKKLVKRVKKIIEDIEGIKFSKIKKDSDIKKRGEIIGALMNEGLWTLPDGAWCSSGIPIFEKMSECGSYPVFRHYNAKGLDVSKFADSDCLAPFYFVYLENGEFHSAMTTPILSYPNLNLELLPGTTKYRYYSIANSKIPLDENLRFVVKKDGNMVGYYDFWFYQEGAQ